MLRAFAVAAAAVFALLAYIYLTLPDVRGLATENPQTTAWMEMRAREASAAGRRLRREQRWVPYSRISRHLERAVLLAEDPAFWRHEGVDLEQIRASMEVNIDEGRAARGASTITQQLAKNLYLSPSRDPVRKLRELLIARRLEVALPKARILELYLNVIEWGDGIWGAEAASRRYFGRPAASLTPAQAALLAGAIINPRVLNPAKPSARLLRRQRILLRRMGIVEPRATVPATALPPADDESAREDLPSPPPRDPLPDEPAHTDPPPPRPCPVPPCAK